ncbi:MAG TPA: DUF4118 domain-containing protein [Bryobacteraceae bacterium]|jgi:hypothetical protein|nr:DUF4118 domain-containing protein [Bryobacteraceae bacterium]
MGIASLAIFSFFVFAVTTRKGRPAGLLLTAACGAAVAFFVMPPVFSFRVARTRDLLTLAFFGTAGLVLTQRAPSRKRQQSIPPMWAPPRERREVALEDIVAEFTASDAGARLRDAAAAIAVKGCALPCTADETFRMLADTVNAALAVPGVSRISIYAAQQPSAKRLNVVAHRIWPTPENEIIMIGQRDSSCTPMDFDGWPPNARSNWFDNGYARIFQISIETGDPNKG